MSSMQHFYACCLSPPSFIPALQMGNFCNIALEEIIDQTRQSHFFFFFPFIYSKKKYELKPMFIKESIGLRTLDAGCSSKGVQAENMIQLC